MKHLKSYRIFESRFDQIKSIVKTLEEICFEFEEKNCSVRIEPSNEIRMKVMALQGKGEVFQDINMPFYIEIDIDRRIIAPDEKRSGFGPLPDWFIENCRRIQDYMDSEGFKTSPSIRYGTDWENLISIEELAEQQSLIYKVKLHFQPGTKLVKTNLNESLLPDLLEYGASVISILTLVAMPFIPVLLIDRKEKKEKKIRELARKDNKLKEIIAKISKYQSLRNLVSDLVSEMKSEDFDEDLKTEYVNRIKSELSKILSVEELEYLDDIIEMV